MTEGKQPKAPRAASSAIAPSSDGELVLYPTHGRKGGNDAS